MCLFGKSESGGCLTCSAEFCSNHGRCDSEMTSCICDSGYGGADCSARVCSAEMPVWYTTFPLRPMKNERFTFIIHGCWDDAANSTGRDVKIVPASQTCDSPASCGMLF